MSNLVQFVKNNEAALTKRAAKYGVNFAVESEFLKQAAKNLTAKPEIIFKTALQVWASGLSFNPSLKHCVLVPYGGDIKPEIMYQGLLSLASKNSNISNIYAEIVRADDLFEVERGINISLKHKIKPFSDSEVVGCYAFVKYADGSIDFELLNLDDIKAIKSAAKTQKIWSGGFKFEMWKKAALRRLLKRVLNSNSTAPVLSLDNENYDFKQSENTDFEIVEIETVKEDKKSDKESKKTLSAKEFEATKKGTVSQIKTVLDKFELKDEQINELLEIIKQKENA